MTTQGRPLEGENNNQHVIYVQAEPFSVTYADVHSLALFLCAEEGWTFAKALREAAADLDFDLPFAQEAI